MFLLLGILISSSRGDFFSDIGNGIKDIFGGGSNSKEKKPKTPKPPKPPKVGKGNQASDPNMTMQNPYQNYYQNPYPPVNPYQYMNPYQYYYNPYQYYYNPYGFANPNMAGQNPMQGGKNAANPANKGKNKNSMTPGYGNNPYFNQQNAGYGKPGKQNSKPNKNLITPAMYSA